MFGDLRDRCGDLLIACFLRWCDVDVEAVRADHGAAAVGQPLADHHHIVDSAPDVDDAMAGTQCPV